MVSRFDLINNPKKLRPHVVVLGSGASKAAFPNGDANGKLVPVMKEIIPAAGIDKLLERNGINYSEQDFEKIYSELYQENPESDILFEFESVVYDYFQSLQLPDSPTLYDYLLVSLRSKDLIATFNWDPFLFDAYKRNYFEIPLPDTVFLHGNVRVGYCEKHSLFGKNKSRCPQCNKVITPTKLLYPVTIKNYSDDIFIGSEWKVLNRLLEEAFTLTIFGFGAPSSDKEAKELMLNAWEKRSKRQLETIEIIDIADRSCLIKKWRPFFKSQHYLHYDSFYKSTIFRYPRRSCEAIYYPTVLGEFVEENPIPQNLEFQELYNWLKPLIATE